MIRSSLRPVLRFRLQTLIVLITLFSIVLGLVFQEVNREQRKRRLAADVERLGGYVRFVRPRMKKNEATGVVNGWLRIFLGDDYFTEVSSVGLKPRSAEDVKMLLAFREVSDLRLSGAAVTDDSLRAVRGLTELHSLEFDGAILSGRGPALLAELPNLINVRFENCSLATESLQALTRATEHSSLRGIAFAGCALTDANLQSMHGAHSSVKLELKNTQVTESGMLALREANPTWSVLYRDGGSGEIDRNYLPSIQELPTTEKLAYRGSLTSSDTLAVLKDAKMLSALELEGCRLTDDDLEHLRPLQELEMLTIKDIPITDEGLRALAGLTKLQTLFLISTKVEGIGVAALPPGIKNLNLVLSNVSERGVATIAKVTNLESLSLVDNRVTDASMDDLAKMASLRRLSLSETKISDSAVARLQQDLPNCEIIIY